jgi:hypothetical protein
MSEPADKVIDATPDGEGLRDHVAPVAGQVLRAAADIDWNRVLAGMDEKGRAKASKRLMGAHPDIRRVRRDRVRLWLALFLIAAAIVDAGVAPDHLRFAQIAIKIATKARSKLQR